MVKFNSDIDKVKEEISKKIISDLSEQIKETVKKQDKNTFRNL